jgi:hypothetical protein
MYIACPGKQLYAKSMLECSAYHHARMHSECRRKYEEHVSVRTRAIYKFFVTLA